jgi:protein gp37
MMSAAHWHIFQVLTKRSQRLAALAPHLRWAPNIWQGVSVESSEYVWRVSDLRVVPATVRFLSIEPLLAPVRNLPLQDIEWVIAGGESGGHRRPVLAEWVREIRDQCLAAGVPFFFKQWGGRTPKSNGRTLDGRTWEGMPSSWLGPMSVG